jgi:hypothetical protein
MRHQLAGKVVGQNCDEKEGANDERTGNSVITAGITPVNHGDAGLVEVKVVYQDTNTECGIHVCEDACDRIMRGTEQGDECSDEDGSSEPEKRG